MTGLLLLGSLLTLTGFIGAVWLAYEGFQVSVLDGILNFCCFPYGVYFIFAKLNSPNKGVIAALYFSGLVGGVINGIAQSQNPQMVIIQQPGR